MENENKEDIVKRLVVILEGVQNNVIDEVISEVKSQLATEIKEVRKNDLEKLFEEQIQHLKDCGYPKAIVELLARQKSSVISKASEMIIAKNHIVFLPVVPRTYRTIYDQISAVKNGGYICLDPNEITDVVRVPQKPYYIFDVEDGRAMLGESPRDAEKAINRQNRFCLTDIEVVTLGIHTDVLSHHYVDAAGSRHDSLDAVPDLRLPDGQPVLFWLGAGHANDKWGSASCGSRIGF